MERNKRLKGFSQTLRKNATKEESLLWFNFLRKYPVQFRRQYVIGNYIADFYCHKARLVIELDGSQHFSGEGPRQDEIRTSFFESQGLFVLRFSNSEVLTYFERVCDSIDLHVKARI